MLYKEIITAKNGAPVPVFKDGKPMHSRYAPEKEAETFAAGISECGFFLIAGLGGAFHIEALQKRFPDSKIAVIEQSCADIDFLEKNISAVKKLRAQRGILITPYEMTERLLLENYLPARDGTFAFIEYRSWALQNRGIIEDIKRVIENTLKKIAADFSVQANFGKIWQRNIILNLKSMQKVASPSFPLNKTALVVAAGPSLDAKIDAIRQKRDALYLIATDTAYSALKKYGIFPDAVCSLDGQHISHAHFMAKANRKTLFVFDVCGNTAAVKKAEEAGAPLLFSSSGHPLASYAAGTQRTFRLHSFGNGAGTVTIMAADFALYAGFPKIFVVGADFSYRNGKAYARGTYLDEIYASVQNRLCGIEEQFCRLQFRAPLIQHGDVATTEILESYRNDFEYWMKRNGLTWKKTDDLYCLSRRSKQPETIKTEPFDFETFTEKLKKDAADFFSGKTAGTNAEIVSLPYAAFCKKNGKTASFKNCVKLALERILQYTHSP